MTADTTDAHAELLQPYLRYLRVDRGLSSNTVENYEADLRVYFIYLKGQGLNPLRVQKDDLTDYLWHRKSSGEQASSVARYIASLRSFYRFLCSENLIPKDPTALLQSPRKPERLPRYLSTEEVNRLMGVLRSGHPASVRLRGMLELMYAAGLRVSELVTLTHDRLDLKVGYVRILGKGGKERVVPIGERARLAVQAYLAIRAPAPAAVKSIFLSNRLRPMSAVQFWRLIAKAAREAGIQQPVTPHMLRHTFASHLVQNGADLRAVQEMLGHSSITTTQIYTHVGTGHLQQAHKKYHPRP
jgi:integrase/recombinase XerD